MRRTDESGLAWNHVFQRLTPDNRCYTSGRCGLPDQQCETISPGQAKLSRVWGINMAARTRFWPCAASITLCAGLAGCASTPHIATLQSAAIVPAPPTASLSIDMAEVLPFAIRRERVESALARAGFESGAPARYRLLLSAAAGSSRTGSFVPGTDKIPDQWIGRPDHSLAGRIFPGNMLRVTAILVDSTTNHEVWRGTGTLRTADPAATAPQLVDQVLAKLPRG